MSTNERAIRALKEILQRPGNDVCADCGALDPGWGSCSLGVFICLDCSGIHRNIPEICKVKSLRLSHWEDQEVQFMAEHGNELMKAKYEADVPVYYYKPTHKDCQVLREQWIRAKYERKEFSKPGKSLTYESETREGTLMKRGRDNGQFLSRRFVLSEREGNLKYYTKYDVRFCLNCSPFKIIILRSWKQMLHIKDTHTKKTPACFDNNKDFQTEGFKKRWFTLDQRRLMYFKDPLDAFAKGEVFLGNNDNHYSASAGLPSGTSCNGAWQYGITIETPERSFLFTCETESDQQEWLKHFKNVMNTQMSPQDYTMEALLRHRH
uniref:ArfGAP with dual PH domains 1 n=1 Tax=Poecilia reticulata TaxID=8081 RepID=A0A3P9MS81_POERE